MMRRDDEPRTIRDLLTDPWTRLGLLGSTLALGELFVHVPASLWAGNLSEFSSAFIAFFAAGLLIVLAGALVVLGLGRILPRPLRAVLASVLCAVGIAGWIYASFLSGQMQVLNGVSAPIEFDTRFGTREVPVAAAVCVLLAIVIGWARRLATPMLTMLNIALFVTTIVTMASAGRTPLRGVATDISQLFPFSTRGNVLVLLLDSLQSDVADGILRADPALAAAFDGFAFYKDTMGVASTTFMTMPVVHAGKVYDDKEPIREYFIDAIAHRSFLTRFAEAGYRASLVEPLSGICPDRVMTCGNTSTFVRSRRERLTHEAARLLDLALLRVAPFELKRRVYADGNWLVAPAVTEPFERGRISEGHRLLNEMGRRLSVDENLPTIKLIHLFTTHVPFVMKDDCRTMAPAHSLDYLPSQSRCGLKSVAALLARLKASNVYDNTVILVMADHGIGTVSSYNALRSFDKPAWSIMAGSANPTFLFKPRGARGPLHDGAGAVHLADVGATLCAATGACTPPAGTAPAGQASPGRVRPFMKYDWKHEFWATLEVPSIERFDVLGPVWESGSWRTTMPIAAYYLGQPLQLSAADVSARYLQGGWSAVERWGRWTSGNIAQMSFHIDPPPSGNGLELVARTWALLPPSGTDQRATWVVNGQELETWRFEPGNTLRERRLSIPRAVLADDGDLRIALRISDPVAPRDLNMGNDARRLGLAFSELTLVDAPATTPAAVPGAPAVTNGDAVPRN